MVTFNISGQYDTTPRLASFERTPESQQRDIIRGTRPPITTIEQVTLVKEPQFQTLNFKRFLSMSLEQMDNLVAKLTDQNER